MNTFNKFKKFIDIKDQSVNTITIISIFLFYIFTTIKALLIFKQFYWYEIMFISISFFVLFNILIMIFFKAFYLKKIKFNKFNIFISIIILILLILLVNEQNPSFYKYYRTFPLLESELGLGWHQDTVFHVSIIQSILNFGYPSIGQHDAPLMVYHTLSHYVDAIIIYIVGLEPYDSYGLMYYFKSFMIISTVSLFLSKVITDQKVFLYLLALVFITPIILGTWHIIGSHGLWFTSIIIIVSSIKVFVILTKKEDNTLLDFFFLFLLILVISFGKISSGFMYAIFIGFYLLYKQPKDFKVYLLGILWITFFYIYQKLMVPYSQDIIIFELNLDLIYNYLTIEKHYSQILFSIYATFIILISILIFFKNKENKILLLALFSTFIILTIISNLKDWYPPDLFYFKYAFHSVMFLFVMQLLFSEIKEKKLSISMSIIFLVILSVISSFYYNQAFKVPYLGIQTKSFKQEYSPFFYINKKFEDIKKVNYIRNVLPKHIKRPLHDFRVKLSHFMIKNDLLKADTLLFISKDIYEEEFIKFNGAKWANGMLIYSITGVPLIYGIYEKHKGYGYHGYNKFSIYSSEFNINKICKTTNKSIIIIDSLNNPKINLYRCQ